MKLKIVHVNFLNYKTMKNTLILANSKNVSQYKNNTRKSICSVDVSKLDNDHEVFKSISEYCMGFTDLCVIDVDDVLTLEYKLELIKELTQWKPTLNITYFMVLF